MEGLPIRVVRRCLQQSCRVVWSLQGEPETGLVSLFSLGMSASQSVVCEGKKDVRCIEKRGWDGKTKELRENFPSKVWTKITWIRDRVILLRAGHLNFHHHALHQYTSLYLLFFSLSHWHLDLVPWLPCEVTALTGHLGTLELTELVLLAPTGF